MRERERGENRGEERETVRERGAKIEGKRERQ